MKNSDMTNILKKLLPGQPLWVLRKHFPAARISLFIFTDPLCIDVCIVHAFVWSLIHTTGIFRAVVTQTLWRFWGTLREQNLCPCLLGPL